MRVVVGPFCKMTLYKWQTHVKITTTFNRVCCSPILSLSWCNATSMALDDECLDHLLGMIPWNVSIYVTALTCNYVCRRVNECSAEFFLYMVHSTRYWVNGTQNTVHSTLDTHSKLNMYTIHFTSIMYTVYWTLLTSLHTAHCILTLDTSHCTQYNLHLTQDIASVHKDNNLQNMPPLHIFMFIHFLIM